MNKMTPRYLQETYLNLCIIIGAAGGAIGLGGWISSGFSNRDALICAVAGAAIFFGFLKVRAIQKEHEPDEPEKDPEEKE